MTCPENWFTMHCLLSFHHQQPQWVDCTKAMALKGCEEPRFITPMFSIELDLTVSWAENKWGNSLLLGQMSVHHGQESGKLRANQVPGVQIAGGTLRCMTPMGVTVLRKMTAGVRESFPAGPLNCLHVSDTCVSSWPTSALRGLN